MTERIASRPSCVASELHVLYTANEVLPCYYMPKLSKTIHLGAGQSGLQWSLDMYKDSFLAERLLPLLHDSKTSSHVHIRTEARAHMQRQVVIEQYLCLV